MYLRSEMELAKERFERKFRRWKRSVVYNLAKMGLQVSTAVFLGCIMLFKINHVSSAKASVEQYKHIASETLAEADEESIQYNEYIVSEALTEANEESIEYIVNEVLTKNLAKPIQAQMMYPISTDFATETTISENEVKETQTSHIEEDEKEEVAVEEEIEEIAVEVEEIEEIAVEVEEARIEEKGFPQLENETDLLAQIITCEAKTGSMKDKIRTGSVIINRVITSYPDFAGVNTIREVLYQHNGTKKQQYASETISAIESGKQASKEAQEVAEGLIDGTIECWDECVLFQMKQKSNASWANKLIDVAIPGLDQYYGIPKDYWKYYPEADIPDYIPDSMKEYIKEYIKKLS